MRIASCFVRHRNNVRIAISVEVSDEREIVEVGGVQLGELTFIVLILLCFVPFPFYGCRIDGMPTFFEINADKSGVCHISLISGFG